MTLATFLNDTLRSLSLELGSIQQQSVRVSICRVCERMMQWVVRSSSAVHNCHSTESLQELLADCRNAASCCLEAGLHRHANRFSKVAEQLTQMLSQVGQAQAAPSFATDHPKTVPESSRQLVLKLLDEIAVHLRKSFDHRR